MYNISRLRHVLYESVIICLDSIPRTVWFRQHPRTIAHLLEGHKLHIRGVDVVLVHLVGEHEQIVLLRKLYDSLHVLLCKHL